MKYTAEVAQTWTGKVGDDLSPGVYRAEDEEYMVVLDGGSRFWVYEDGFVEPVIPSYITSFPHLRVKAADMKVSVHLVLEK